MAVTTDLAQRFAARSIRRGRAGADMSRRYTYRANYLCPDLNIQTQSVYVLRGRSGSFSEDECGTVRSGKLAFVAEAKMDSEFGPVAGFIYNSVGAEPECSFFFSNHEVLFGSYVAAKGKPYASGDPMDYDIWEGLGAMRTSP